jgi:hypothetical protein
MQDGNYCVGETVLEYLLILQPDTGAIYLLGKTRIG